MKYKHKLRDLPWNLPIFNYGGRFCVEQFKNIAVKKLSETDLKGIVYIGHGRKDRPTFHSINFSRYLASEIHRVYPILSSFGENLIVIKK